MRVALTSSWADARKTVLESGNGPAAGVALQALDHQLRTVSKVFGGGLMLIVQDIAAVTDEHVYDQLRANDLAQEKYLDDDPSLAVILQQLQIRQG
jgi:hypothetical protein